MIKKGRDIYLPHPAIVYLALTIIVILTSWIGSIYEIRGVNKNDELILRNLLNVQGIRWMVRSAASSLSTAPIGNALLILISIGIGISSGIWKTLIQLFSRGKLSPKERNAITVSVIILFLYLVMIGLGLFGKSHLLLGVTGTLHNSPFLSGAVFLLTLAIVLPSIFYGMITDAFRTADDCINAGTYTISTAASFLITMLFASQLLSAINYSHLDIFLHLNTTTMNIISLLLYWIPLPIILVRQVRS